MDPQIIVVVAIATLAVAFIAWRLWTTLRVARGDKACTSCGCDKPARKATP